VIDRGGRRLQIAAGAVLAVVAVAAVAIAVLAGGGTSGKPRLHGTTTVGNVAISPPANTNLRAAAAAAGCVLLNPPSEGRLHVLGPVHYRTNPPSSGSHYPVPAHDGIYAPGSTPPKEQLVHALEHGRVEVQYQPGSSTTVIGALQSLATEFATRDSDPRVLLFQNATAMPYAIAAVAWTHILGCNRYAGAPTLDAIRDFRTAYDLKAPEQFFIDAE
jgi:Protein of unknown function (DUF3105)